MSRPKGGYKVNGKRVPGVTTITGRWKESGGLIHWAYQCGVDGIDYRKARDKAAGTGTWTHERMDAFIHGREWTPPDDATDEDLEAVGLGFAAFERWAKGVNIEVIATETPLVSETHRFGGTPDAIVMCCGMLGILDLKTGGIYGDHVLQLGAYAVLWEETDGGKVDEGHLLRVGKEHGEFSHTSLPRKVIEMGRDQFLRLREAYEYDKAIRKVVK